MQEQTPPRRSCSAMKAGIAPEVFYGAIASGAGTSRMFEVRGPMMVAGSCEQAP